VFLPEFPKIRPKRQEAQEIEKALDIEGLLKDALNKTEKLLIKKNGVYKTDFS
jgi:hypothetical protein